MFDKVSKLSRFVTEFYLDMMSYVRHCGISPLQDANLRRGYKLLIEAHALEKGLSLADPRPFFGKAKISFLMAELDRYSDTPSALPRAMVMGVLRTYVQAHRDRGLDDPILIEIDDYIAARPHHGEAVAAGGLRHLRAAYDHVDKTPAEFVASRFSNRILSDSPLDLGQIERVVALAQTAPSQCNRQSSHAHFYQERAQIRSLLELQGGASGFAQEVGNLFVISNDLAAWGGAQQRNQPYVDGALFAMALIYACHANGVAVCPLNLAITHRQDRRIKQAGGIPVDQRLIMMIAVGLPKDVTQSKAAGSPRRPAAEIFHPHPAA